MVGERGRAVVGDRLDLPRRRDQLAAVVEQRKADVEVVGDHVRHGLVAQVLDHVVDEQPALAQSRPDAACQPDVLARARLRACAPAPT